MVKRRTFKGNVIPLEEWLFHDLFAIDNVESLLHLPFFIEDSHFA